VARAGKPVNVKKGQFLAPWDMGQVVEKIVATGNRQVLVTERGVSFGYNNLVADFRSLAVLRELGCPVVFDATHSVQLPGGQGTASGGQRQFVAPLARAAVAVGVDAVFMEVHEDPDRAPSDGPNSVRLADVEALLRDLVALHAVATERLRIATNSRRR
jgi:2-dehydro-3-deoxyphosphooctonate aldolase (KDO 8-P synthase)